MRIGNGGLRNPKNMVLFVVGQDARHLFEGVATVGCADGYTSGTDGLFEVTLMGGGLDGAHPQLSEVYGAAVEVRNVSHQQPVLLLPVANGHSSADDGGITQC